MSNCPIHGDFNDGLTEVFVDVDGILFRDPNQQRGTQALRMGDGSCGQKKTYRGPVISRRKLAVAVREVRRYRQWEHARCDLSRARYGLSRPGPAVRSLSNTGEAGVGESRVARRFFYDVCAC